jgi:hypothetical protein
MAVATITKPGSTAAFAAAAVEAKVRCGLLDFAISTAAMHGVTLPATTAGQCAASVNLDSLGVVELLCEIEPIIGFELKDSIVKSGGYKSVDEAVSRIMPRIESAWQKHTNKDAKK